MKKILSVLLIVVLCITTVSMNIEMTAETPMEVISTVDLERLFFDFDSVQFTGAVTSENLYNIIRHSISKSELQSQKYECTNSRDYNWYKADDVKSAILNTFELDDIDLTTYEYYDAEKEWVRTSIGWGGAFDVNVEKQEYKNNEWYIQAKNNFDGKVLFLVLSDTLKVKLCCVIDGNNTEFAGGSGTEFDPYLIATKDHLDNVRNYLRAHFKMITDIEFSSADFAEGGEFYNDGSGWIPIGTDAASFSGTFDGNGYLINGLLMKAYKRFVGMFGYNAGSIFGVGVVNCNTKNDFADAHNGGIVGYNVGSIEFCYFSGSVSGGGYVGGIVGTNVGSVENCFNLGNVISMQSAGGIAGGNGSWVSACYNIGDISGGTSGGIVGYKSPTGKVECCYYLENNNKGVGDGSDSAVKQTLLQMKQQTSYNYYDFDSVWTMGGNVDYPFPELKSVPLQYDRVVKSITIESMPQKTKYIENYEQLDLTGGTIQIVCAYDVNHIVDLSETQVTGFNNTVIGKQSLTVSYMGCTTEIEIEIVEKSIERIELSTLPQKLMYHQAQDGLDVSGGKVTVFYNDKSQEVIDLKENMITGFDNVIPGDLTLFVEVEGQKASFDIAILSHDYSNMCDVDCNTCGATRGVGEHKYANICDTDCDGCGAIRTVAGHSYINSCDTTCDKCGAMRTITHTYSNSCDDSCNICGIVRNITHTYGSYVYNDDATCDQNGTKTRVCSVCGQPETVTAAGTRLKNSSAMFSDVQAGEWYKPYIDYAVTYRLLNGTGNGMEPTRTMTRAEFVQVLANLSGIDTSNKQVNAGFKDVKAGDWYAPAVMWASTNGIVNGMEGNRFAPNDHITREQMCTMLIRYIEGYLDATLTKKVDKKNFADDAKISDWAKESVYKCQMGGLVNGVSETMFAPADRADRAAVATIMTRYHLEYINN